MKSACLLCRSVPSEESRALRRILSRLKPVRPFFESKPDFLPKKKFSPCHVGVTARVRRPRAVALPRRSQTQMSRASPPAHQQRSMRAVFARIQAYHNSKGLLGSCQVETKHCGTHISRLLNTSSSSSPLETASQWRLVGDMPDVRHTAATSFCCSWRFFRAVRKRAFFSRRAPQSLRQRKFVSFCTAC